jgi:hypothetical protein
MPKETYRYTVIPEVCVCASVKRGLPYGKRDLLYTQKRPTNTNTPEVCVSVKRDLL